MPVARARIFQISTSEISFPSKRFVSLISSASITAQTKFTGRMSVPLMIAMLGLKASSSFLGGIRWMRMAPGPFGLSVVCRTSVNSVSMYFLILRTVLVFLNARGIVFDIVSSLVDAKRRRGRVCSYKYSISQL